MAAVYKRELHGYFTSMIGYVVLAFMLFFPSVYFIFLNLYSGYPLFGYALSSISFIFMIVIPILTMRSLSEERRNKTDQLLFTSPVSLWKIIAGKYLSMVTVMGAVCLVLCTCPLIIRMFGGIYTLSDYVCILAFFLYGCASIAIGLFISSLTESQIIACVGTFGVLLILYLMPGMTEIIPDTAGASFLGFWLLILLVAYCFYQITKNWMAGVIGAAAGTVILTAAYLLNADAFAGAFPAFLNSLSLASRFDSFVYQVLDVPAVIYYISISVLFVFLTVQSVEKRRWS